MTYGYSYSDCVPPKYNKYFNIKGEPIRQTPITHPYSFDTYCVYRDIEFFDMKPQDMSVAHSDRLDQWDRDKFDHACKLVGGINSFDYNPEIAQKFLSVYFDKEIKLLAIEKACNVGNGYPYWIFYYKEN